MERASPAQPYPQFYLYFQQQFRMLHFFLKIQIPLTFLQSFYNKVFYLKKYRHHLFSICCLHQEEERFLKLHRLHQDIQYRRQRQQFFPALFQGYKTIYSFLQSAVLKLLLNQLSSYNLILAEFLCSHKILHVPLSVLFPHHVNTCLQVPRCFFQRVSLSLQ